MHTLWRLAGAGPPFCLILNAKQVTGIHEFDNNERAANAAARIRREFDAGYTSYY